MAEEVPPIRKWIGAVLLVASGLVIAGATLTPAGPGGRGGSFCLLICGPRGLADLAANILLFLPFGMGLGLLGTGALASLLLGVVASTGIELAQVVVVSGRDANFADIVANSTGALLGAMLGRGWSVWLLPSPRGARRYLAGAAAGALLVIIATGALLAPRFPARPYHLRLTEGGAAYAAYPGRVIAVTLGGVDLPIAARRLTPEVRAQLVARQSLTVHIERGAEWEGLGHIVSITVGPSDVLFLGAQGADLILRYRSAAGSFRLDQPTVRLNGGHRALEQGERFTATVRRVRTGFCLQSRGRETCSAPTPASGWELLQNAEFYSPWLQAQISLGWMILLGFPLGLWFRRDWLVAVLVGVTAFGLVILPFAVGLRPLEWREAIAGCTGLLLGLGVQWVIVRIARR